MLLVLRDTNPEVVAGWLAELGGYRSVSIGVGDLLRERLDAAVSPANSYGRMDGGIDLAYRNRFGLVIERRVREAIDRRGGELAVGAALVVPTGDGWIPRLVVAPTMRTPRRLTDAEPVYRAMRAAIECARATTDPIIERLGVPGMGTGVGHLDPFLSAAAVRRALDEMASETTPPPPGA